jgi:hypothetical protein
MYTSVNLSSSELTNMVKAQLNYLNVHNEKRREGVVGLERRKRDVLRDVVNLPCAGKHVCSDGRVRGAVWSWGFPLVPAGI